MAATKPHGRNDNTRWRNARRRAITNAQGVCQLCRGKLDSTKPAKHPDSTEVDHIVPLSQGGAPYELTNLRAVHRRCHQHRDTFDRRPGWWHTDSPTCSACPHSQQWIDSMEWRAA